MPFLQLFISNVIQELLLAGQNFSRIPPENLRQNFIKEEDFSVSVDYEKALGYLVEYFKKDFGA